jgi:hypothetical protein
MCRSVCSGIGLAILDESIVRLSARNGKHIILIQNTGVNNISLKGWTLVMERRLLITLKNTEILLWREHFFLLRNFRVYHENNCSESILLEFPDDSMVLSKLELISGENVIVDSIDFVTRTRSKVLLGAVFLQFLRLVPLLLIILLVYFPEFLSDLYLSSYIRFERSDYYNVPRKSKDDISYFVSKGFVVNDQKFLNSLEDFFLKSMFKRRTQYVPSRLKNAT